MQLRTTKGLRKNNFTFYRESRPAGLQKRGRLQIILHFRTLPATPAAWPATGAKTPKIKHMLLCKP